VTLHKKFIEVGIRFRAFAIDAMLDSSAAMSMRLYGRPTACREREIERL
jgi:hypothetical protein